jgi:hypothetical protein
VLLLSEIKEFWGSLLGTASGYIIGLGILFVLSLFTRPKWDLINSTTIWDFLVSMTITFLTVAIIVPATGPHPMSLGRKTFGGISVLKSHIYNYYCESGQWPNESDWKKELSRLFEGQIKAEEEYAYFVGGWGNDGWENPIQYRIIEEGGIQTVLLYSYGKNKIDDNGTGDDITRKIEIPTSEEINNYKANTEAAVGGGML